MRAHRETEWPLSISPTASAPWPPPARTVRISAAHSQSPHLPDRGTQPPLSNVDEVPVEEMTDEQKLEAIASPMSETIYGTPIEDQIITPMEIGEPLRMSEIIDPYPQDDPDAPAAVYGEQADASAAGEPQQEQQQDGEPRPPVEPFDFQQSQFDFIPPPEGQQQEQIIDGQPLDQQFGDQPPQEQQMETAAVRTDRMATDKDSINSNNKTSIRTTDSTKTNNRDSISNSKASINPTINNSTINRTISSSTINRTISSSTINPTTIKPSVRSPSRVCRTFSLLPELR